MRRTGLTAAGTALLATLLVAPSFAHPGHPEHPGEQPPPATSEFEKVVLNDTPGEPIDLAVLPDSRVLHTTRGGDVWLHDPKTGLNTLAGQVDVYSHDEEGLQSIALDPGFDGKKNRWVYLYYAPPMDTPVDDPATPDVNEGDAPATGTPADFAPFKGVVRLSRFQFNGDSLDLGSEQQILDVDQDRGICCHVGGDIESDGYAPLDERPDRNPVFDAQRTSANTDDLRGKVLRITVGRDGSYTVPEGNLFAPGTPGTRPEIYLMGLRNPFRVEYNQRTDELYVADYSPDAGQPDADRGPNGHGKWFVTRQPGNYGWPYCATPALPYTDYDFATGESGAAFDCAAPVNESPNNTGLTELPPVEQPEVWYPGAGSADFPELGTGGVGPMAGPAYHFDRAATRGPRPVAWPRRYDGVPLFYEWTRDYVKGFHVGADGVEIEDVLPGMAFHSIIDMEFGPDGALYVLEYGKGYFGELPDAKLARIDYVGPRGNHSPVPRVAADVTDGQAPLTVSFSSEGTVDPDGDRLRYAWDFDSDGTVDSRRPNPVHTYRTDGVHVASLRVTDVGGRGRGKSASAEIDIVVGNSAPVVEFVTPRDGDAFEFGDVVAFEVRVTDDQPVDCARVRVSYILGHDQHGHPMTSAMGCAGTLRTSLADGHNPDEDNLRGVFVAEYTDPGTDGLPPLSGRAEVVLVPGH
jgi:glucose/arabinose dehydrogenase